MSFLVASLVFLSSAAALIYETVWLRQVAQALGQTVAATTAVLTAWMGGLALGAALIAPHVRRLSRPLACYGGLELFIALGAGLVAPALAVLRGLDLRFAGAGGAGPWSPITLCALIVVLLPITMAMGATFPLLVRVETAAGRSAGGALGSIAAFGTAGAVAGTLLAGFAMVEDLGLAGTVRASQAVGTLVGIVALLTSQLAGPAAPPGETTAPAPAVPVESTPALRILSVHVFLTGFVTMLFEVCLFRLMPLVLGSSLQSSSTVLAALLAGLTVGGAVAGLAAARLQRPERALAILIVSIGGMLFLAVPTINSLPVIFAGLREILSVGFAAYHAITFVVCFGLMLMPAIGLGAALPLAVEAARAARESVPGVAGRLYAASALGNLTGVVATGLALVPGAGSALSLELGATVAAASGVVLLWRDSLLSRPLVAAMLSVAVLGAAFRPGLAVLPLTAGVFQRPPAGAPPGISLGQRFTAGRALLSSEEDDVNLVTVERSIRTGARALRINGKVDASTTVDDMRTQRLLAHAPLLLHPGARSVLVIGLGSGVTLRSALRHGVETLHCVEISRAVIRAAARWFAEENGQSLHDPRVTLILDDARRYVDRTAHRYDVVISEPSNPWMAGVGNLYTMEFFQRVRERLNAGGLLCQWIHTYDLDTGSLAMVMRTVRRVFPHVHVLRLQRGDLALIASATPIHPSLELLRERMKSTDVLAELTDLHVGQPLAFLGLQLIASEDLERFCGLGGVQTDDRPVLEYRAARTLHSGIAAVIPEKAFRTGTRNSWVRQQLETRDVGGNELIEFCELARDQYDPDIYLTLLQELVAMVPGDPRTRALLAEALEARGELSAALNEASKAVQLKPENLQLQRLRFRIAFALDGRFTPLVARPSFQASFDAALACMKLAPDDFESHLDLGAVRLRRQEWKDAESSLRAGVAISKQFPDRAQLALDPLHLLVAQCRFRQGDLTGAQQHLDKVSRAHLTKPEHLDLEQLLRTDLELARRSVAPPR